MAVRPILLFPDPRLKAKAELVTEFGADLASLVADLVDTLTSVSAIGLTAPHLGIGLRIFVVRMEPGAPVRSLVNPELLWASDEAETHEEGSVSMPGMRERVERPSAIRMAFRDPTGESGEIEASGFEAAVLLHELDQLDGIFWTARLSRLRRERLEKRFAKRDRGDTG